jgi:hypothetical protein
MLDTHKALIAKTSNYFKSTNAADGIIAQRCSAMLPQEDQLCASPHPYTATYMLKQQ